MDGYESKVPAEWRRSKGTSWLPWLFTVAALVAGGYLGFRFWRLEHDAAEAARSQRDEIAGRAAQLQTRSDEAVARAAALEHRVETLESDKGSLTAEVQEKDAELAKLRQTYDSLQEKMKQEIAQGEIRLSQSGGRIQVELVDKILFDSGKSEVTEKGAEILSRLGGVLAKLDDKLIQVSGHTDDSPIKDKDLQEKFPTNWELSVSRAVNVVRYLSEKAEVPPKRLVAAGHGQYLPIANNATREGRARNRRIELLLTPIQEQKPSEVAAAKVSAPKTPPPKKRGSP
jgi:chemotaxis protein MotB